MPGEIVFRGNGFTKCGANRIYVFYDTRYVVILGANEGNKALKWILT